MVEDESFLARTECLHLVRGNTRGSVICTDLDDSVGQGDMQLGQLVTQVKHAVDKNTLSITDLQTILVGSS